MAFTTKRKLPRSVLVLVATCWSLLIAACGSLAARDQVGSSTGCVGAECKVDVNVNNCDVSAAPPTIYVLPNFNVIKWTIQATDGTGYHFPPDGITIKSPGSGVTPDPGVTGNGKMFVMHDDHTVPGPIPYNVLVVRDSNGAACPLLDPIIYNQ